MNKRPLYQLILRGLVVFNELAQDLEKWVFKVTRAFKGLKVVPSYLLSVAKEGILQRSCECGQS